VGDSRTEQRLREVAERTFEPRWFGEDGDRFGWWFHLGEEYPRGQLCSLMMLTELGEPGSWGLWVETYAAAPARGARTTWRVTQLPDAASASVQCDGSEFPAWRVVEPGTIELDTDIGEHRFRIATGYRGDAPARTAGERRGSLVVPRRTSYVPAAPGGGSCCG
jgi:hypothetical protein